MTNVPGYTKISHKDFKSHKMHKSTDLASLVLNTTLVSPTTEMITPQPEIYFPEEFADTDPWMGGWRILKLGLAGTIHGFDIDTSFFKGKHAPAASVDATYCPEGGETIYNVVWTQVLGKVDLSRNSHNIFALEHSTKIVYTHVRLNNYSDGGIPRLRVYGNVHPTLPKDPNALIDLAYVGHGGRSVHVSDGSGDFLLWPSKGKNQGVEGNTDFPLLHLDDPSHILQAEVETSHFQRNFPRQIKLEATHSESLVPEDDAAWWILAEHSSAGPNGVFYFNTAFTEKVFTHAKISILPDGGLKRIRLYGVCEGGQIPALPIIVPSVPENTIIAEPLTPEDYAAYGDVIHTGAGEFITGANQGTAEKHHRVAQIVNNFPNAQGQINMCMFHCRPTNELPFTVKLLERHPYSSQAFIPMTDGKTRGYLVIVALNHQVDDKPDMSTLKAFIATSKQGINYGAGVWHHPMVALEHETDFACIVHESGVPEDDCHEVDVPHVVVHVPGFFQKKAYISSFVL